MTKTTITITYSEDFRGNKIAPMVYGILRDNNLSPESVHTDYWVSRGVGETRYDFYGDTKSSSVPDKSKLKEMLQEINLTSLKVSHR
ncbi:hypothetical protein LCGC14_2362400 [marine sediment metagenome]|uniref:Uncharacterized protein n=1 Tax=marine sediment metagenome TaxID=412755 RepID=A0A0F9CTL6_9ZZZZ